MKCWTALTSIISGILPCGSGAPAVPAPVYNYSKLYEPSREDANYDEYFLGMFGDGMETEATKRRIALGVSAGRARRRSVEGRHQEGRDSETG